MLGVLAGLLDVAFGSSIRGWVGNKLDTTTLGAGTIALSFIALAAAIAWRRPGGQAGGRRLATVIALAVPALICFTTIGRLWYLPGLLLLAAAIIIVASSTREELAGALTRHTWLAGLMVALGGYYVFLGADAFGHAGVLGILGGVLVWAALFVRTNSRSVGLALVTIGAMPFAIATWWSVVVPVTALLILLIGGAEVQQASQRPTSVPTA